MNVSEAKATDRKDLTGPALRTFFRIAEAWGLKEQEQMRLLGLDSRSHDVGQCRRPLCRAAICRWTARLIRGHPCNSGAVAAVLPDHP